MSAWVLTGDNVESLRSFPDNSIDSIVTDPPYGLGKPPDLIKVLAAWIAGLEHDVTGGGFMGKKWDAFVPSPTVWRECLRVLKPGGHLVSFFGTRTYHLGVLSIALAGFEIRDQLAWMYGTGFPKSLDVSKAIDKALGAEREITGHRSGTGNKHMCGEENGKGFGPTIQITAPASLEAIAAQGQGTALKPAYEPIVLARKPLIGTVAANVLAHGTGGLRIDDCRIAGGYETRARVTTGGASMFGTGAGGGAFVPTDGRWPANVILDEAAGDLLDEQSGTSKDGVAVKRNGVRNDNPIAFAGPLPPGTPDQGFGGSGGASRFFYCAKASRSEREAGLDHLRKAGAGELTGGRTEGSAGLDNPRAGAGRTSKAGRANVHPTVKPIALMRWLVRLVTPVGGVVLDPFAGSGSTGCAAVAEGCSFVGLELSEEYATIARARIEATDAS